jgi:CheY-specific phosphatase CheX
MQRASKGIKIGPEVLRAFAKQVVDVASIQCAMPLKVDKPIQATLFKEKPPTWVVGTRIDFQSTTFSGEFTLYFQRDTFLALMSGMLMSEIQEVDDDVRDGAKELLNIIFGGVKTHLSDQGLQLEMAIPTLLDEKKQEEFAAKSPSQAVYVPFRSNFGVFYGRIQLWPKSAAA